MIVFVFGSNLAGIHGKGAALHAKHFYGAKQGIGVGFVDRSYAIPTKDANLKTLHILDIVPYVNEFKHFALTSQHRNYLVTRIGCGLAGFRDEDIAPLFRGSPENCFFSARWSKYL